MQPKFFTTKTMERQIRNVLRGIKPVTPQFIREFRLYYDAGLFQTAMPHIQRLWFEPTPEGLVHQLSLIRTEIDSLKYLDDQYPENRNEFAQERLTDLRKALDVYSRKFDKKLQELLV